MLLLLLYLAVAKPIIFLSSAFALLVFLTLIWRSFKVIWSPKREAEAESAILITGATSGIGLALAKYLYSQVGYSVIVGYYNSKEPGYEELKRLSGEREEQSVATKKRQQQRMLFVELDVRDQSSVSAAYEKCCQELQHNGLVLRALVNNAGLGSLTPFAWLQRSLMNDLIDTNLKGALLMVREFLPLLIASKGRILNVSSGLGVIPGPTYATYGITKSSLIYFTRCLNMELERDYGVKSIAIIPNNLIKDTNICAQNAKRNEAAWEELKPAERSLYAKGFEEHRRRVKELDGAIAERTSDSTTADKTKMKVKKSSNNNLDHRDVQHNDAGELWTLMKLISEFFSSIRGANTAEAPSLEDSGILQCFEEAIRLPSPPELIFAGNRIYNILIGSILLSMPTSCLTMFSSLVSLVPSLYR